MFGSACAWFSIVAATVAAQQRRRGVLRLGRLCTNLRALVPLTCRREAELFQHPPVVTTVETVGVLAAWELHGLVVHL